MTSKNDEELIGDEISYLNIIGALMYLVNSILLDICFAVSLLARCSSSPTKTHENDVKHIFKYFWGIIDMRLFYSNEFKPQIIDNANVEYLFDWHKTWSKTCYFFTYEGKTIFWRSIKQTLAVISANHAK